MEYLKEEVFNSHFRLFLSSNSYDLLRKLSSIATINSDSSVRKEVWIKYEDLSYIITQYYADKKIHWNETVSGLKEPLELSLVHLLKKSVDWNCFIKNHEPNIIPLLREFKNEINWFDIHCLDSLKWTSDLIDEFKDYLIFTDHIIIDGKISQFAGSEYTSWTGRRYRSSDQLGIKRFQCLSSSSNLDWTSDILLKFQDHWDWILLSQNRNIFWSKKLVLCFLEKIQFQSISWNTNVDWENVLPILVANEKSQKNKIDWGVISVNRSCHFIIDKPKYWNKIIWKMPTTAYYKAFEAIYFKRRPVMFVSKYNFNRYNNKGTYSEIGIVQNDEKSLYTKNYSMPSYSCISANTNISWTLQSISQHITKLDFWLIALRGKLTTEIVVHFAAFFDEIRHTSTDYIKHSDWGSYPVYNYTSGWHNLAKNPNFQIDDEFLDFASRRKVRVVDSLDTFDNDENANSVISTPGRWVLLKGLFSPKRDFKIDYSQL